MNGMIGAIIGDIVGSRFEFNNYKAKDFELFTDQCRVTDDSIMTLAVAKAIMETEKITRTPFDADRDDSGYYAVLGEMAVKTMQEIGRKYPNCGYGGMFNRWLFSHTPQPYNSFGNGAAMRISPAGFTATSEIEAKELAATITKVTHNHAEGIKGAIAVAVAIFMAAHSGTKEAIREKITTHYYPLNFTIDQIRATYEFNPTCQATVPQAIEAFLESVSFEDAIRLAVSLGGDSDTLAAIAGAISEAYYGVPEEMKEKALTYLDDDLRAIYEEWDVFCR
ncbi:ADP-ribosylglycohydrolase family protein [Dehalobacter sp. DCM]|uniref:ADP-ribosylglycohydrolase family protein n=1 Tax=Dehalobacter sp. DCM TaxID=2907827 RepID=UPI003081DD0E|nr:ADP-ribosylglycohydrolase family protein [Dehalobacter sp. DCM]